MRTNIMPYIPYKPLPLLKDVLSLLFPLNSILISCSHRMLLLIPASLMTYKKKLVCISLMATQLENAFMGLLAIYILSFEKSILFSFGHLLFKKCLFILGRQIQKGETERPFIHWFTADHKGRS